MNNHPYPVKINRIKNLINMKIPVNINHIKLKIKNIDFIKMIHDNFYNFNTKIFSLRKYEYSILGIHFENY